MPQHVAFAVNNLFQQQRLKVIKPTKRLKYTIESIVKAASLLLSTRIPTCKHFNRHGHAFDNHRKIIIIEQLRNIRTASTETLKEITKTMRKFLDNEI